jgi:LacI family transcriptional regulator
MARITLQQIADEVGVSRATVSLAMRFHPGIPEATRNKVLKCAEKLRYRPNPLISALMADMRTHGGVQRTCNLAYLSHYTREEMIRFPSAQRYFDGATARASEFGYKLDWFTCSHEAANQIQLGNILLARGIPGVLISPASRANYTMHLPWQNLCAATLGYTLKTPYLNRSINHQHHTLMLAIRKCLEYGYSKIGLLVNREENHRVEYLFQGAYLSYQQTIPERDRIPLTYIDSMTRKKLKDWLKKYQPDVLVGTSYLWADEVRRDFNRELAIVLLDRSKEHRGFAGVDQRPDLVGAGGIDLVIQSLMTNAYGVPKSPKTVLIEGVWVDGASLPPKSRSASPASLFW